MPKIGRPSGSKNRKTVGMIIAKRKGISPLEFVLSVMDNEDNDLSVRLDAAKSAVPYCHARLAQTRLGVDVEEPITKIVTEIVYPKHQDG
jgi:hypothetical protein